MAFLFGRPYLNNARGWKVAGTREGQAADCGRRTAFRLGIFFGRRIHHGKVEKG